jgi:uncharacterized membrane protein YcaP (DUF421 family)
VFDLGTPWWQIVVRTFVVYGAVLVGLRLTGRRQLGQMTLGDLVVVLLIANAVQNAMVGPDASLVGGMVAAAALLVANALLARVVYASPRVERMLGGEPVLLVRDGHVLLQNLQRERVNRDELESAIREHAVVGGVSGVRAAFLEVDGTISVIPMDAKLMRGTRKVRRVRQLRKR